MKPTTHRALIEAAVAILSDGKPRTASILSRLVRETCNLPHRADRMNDVMTAAMGEGVVKPGPRIKGSRSVAWTLGDQPLPDWLFVRERPQPEPAADLESIKAEVFSVAHVIGRLDWISAKIDRIEATLADLAADRKPRPLFDQLARRNGH